MSGLDVAVTTTREAAPRLAGHLEEAGLHPVPLPCIRVVPAEADVLRRARSAAAAADWLIVTSGRVVELLWPHGGMPPIDVAAVGPATAEVVRSAGGRVRHVGSSGAAQLIEGIAADIAGAVVLYPRAGTASPATADRLRRVGARLVEEMVYETVPMAPADDEVDAAAFTSPSAVEGWFLARHLDDVDVVAAIGPATVRALRERGRSPEVVPARPGYENLALALAEHVSERKPA